MKQTIVNYKIKSHLIHNKNRTHWDHFVSWPDTLHSWSQEDNFMVQTGSYQ